MLRLLNVMIMAGVGAALLAPLLYGFATLSGMRHKRIYPILRVKCRDRRMIPAEEHGYEW